MPGKLRSGRLTALDLISLALALVAAAGFYAFPYISDDLKSTESVKDTFLYGMPLDFGAYFRNIGVIFTENHFRLPNLLMPLIILLPRWLTALVSGIALWWTMAVAARLGRFSDNYLRYSLLVAGTMIAFPWTDQLYLLSFQAPYLWGAAMAVSIIYMILHRRESNPWISGILCFVMGFWHEAYAAAILGGVICLLIFRRSYRTRSIVAAAAGLSMGILTDALPSLILGTWLQWGFFEGRMMLLYPYLILTAIYLLWAAAAYARGSRRISVTELFLLESAIASAILTYYFKTGARIDGLGVICALTGMIMLLPQGFDRSKLSRIVAMAILALIAIHLAAVDAMCFRLRAETDYVVDQYRKNPDQVIFAPVTFRRYAPWYLLQKPHYDWFGHTATVREFTLAYGTERHPLRVVPKELRGFSASQGTPMAGSADLISWHDHMLCPAHPEAPGPWLNVDYGRGTRKLYFYIVPFRSEADGKDYLWFYPDQTLFEHIISSIPLQADTVAGNPWEDV